MMSFAALRALLFGNRTLADLTARGQLTVRGDRKAILVALRSVGAA
jgi:hypothetical protein